MPEEIELLLERARKKTLPNTLLFAGPEGSGKHQAALRLASELLETKEPEKHPDFHFYTPDASGNIHTIEAMRRLIDEVYIAPFSASRKVFLIEKAHRMLPTSSNALLKTLEEPALECTIILLSDRPDAILPTIRSRARRCVFYTKKKQEIGRSTERDLLVTILSEKISYPTFLKKIAAFDEVESPEKILEEILYWHRDRHLLAHGGDPSKLYFSAYLSELKNSPLPMLPLMHIFEKIEKARFALQQHIKLRHCIEMLYHS